MLFIHALHRRQIRPKHHLQLCGFISNLNSRIKEILFINKNKRNYDQFMMLAMILTFDFKSYDALLDKIQFYILNFKKFYMGKFSINEIIDDSPVIEIDCVEIDGGENNAGVIDGREVDGGENEGGVIDGGVINVGEYDG